jgi:glycosyltransferase involved in cell wall biosynthesis
LGSLNLADSAGLLKYIEEKFTLYEIEGNRVLTEWFVKYLLRHRYWGRAYSFIRKIEKIESLNEFLLKTKKALEKNFSLVDINIESLFFQKKDIDKYRSSELIFSTLLKKIQYKPKSCGEKKIKRIALVLTSLGPGGAERQCVNLFNGLLQKVKEGKIEDVRLYVTSLTRTEREGFYLSEVVDKNKVIEFYDRANPIEIDYVPALKPYAELVSLIQPVTRQQAIISLTKHLSDYQPTVIHGWQNEAILNSFLVGKILHTCSLFGRWGSLPPTVSRNLTEGQRRNVEYMYYAYKELTSMQNNQIFSANSKIAARSYEEWIGTKKLKVETVYNGLNVEKLKVTIDRDSMKRKLDIPSDSLIVGSIYRISDEKRPFLWVEIAKEVNRKFNKKVHFVLVGDGPLRTQVEELVESKNLGEYIHLVGRQDDVSNWYNIMDVFLLTSAVEGISNSMLEAEYMGVPVVVPDVGGLKEAMIDKKTGFLLSTDTVEKFSDKIIYLLRNRWGEKEKKFSRQYIEKKFSIYNMIENTLSFYRRNLYEK